MQSDNSSAQETAKRQPLRCGYASQPSIVSIRKDETREQKEEVHSQIAMVASLVYRTRCETLKEVKPNNDKGCNTA